MEFNSHTFILIFMPAVFLSSLFFEKRLYLVLLIFSLIFYGWDSSIALGLLLIATLLVHYSKKLILNIQHKNLKNIILMTVILLVILPFVFFRAASMEYFVFKDIKSAYPYLAILPAGISFYTFQLIGYLIDEIPDFRKFSFFDSLLFTSFFPQLIAGPIEKANKLMPQLLRIKRTPFSFEYTSLRHGFLMISIGLFSKTFLADVFAYFIPSEFYKLGFLNCIIFILSHGLVLYFDFLGYSLIALGLARLFDIKLTLNFNRPYAATNIRQFWRCWHITLTRWFTNYIYKPINSSYNFSFKAKLVGAIIVFTFTSLWHGFGLRFLIWGFSHMFLVLLTFLPFVINLMNKVPKYVGWIFNLFSVNILWIFFLFPLEKSSEIINYLINPENSISLNGYMKFVIMFVVIFSISIIYNPSVLMIRSLNNQYKIDQLEDEYLTHTKDSSDMVITSLSASITKKLNLFFGNIFVTSIMIFISIIHFSFASTFIYFRF